MNDFTIKCSTEFCHACTPDKIHLCFFCNCKVFSKLLCTVCCTNAHQWEVHSFDPRKSYIHTFGAVEFNDKSDDQKQNDDGNHRWDGSFVKKLSLAVITNRGLYQNLLLFHSLIYNISRYIG